MPRLAEYLVTLVILLRVLQVRVLQLKVGLSCLSHQEGPWYQRLLLTLSVCGPSLQLAFASKLQVSPIARLFSRPRFELELEVSSVTRYRSRGLIKVLLGITWGHTSCADFL